MQYYLQNPNNSEESKYKLKQKMHFVNLRSFFATYPQLQVQYNQLGQKQEQQLSYYGILI